MQLIPVARHFVVAVLLLLLVLVGVAAGVGFVAGDADCTGFAGVGVAGIVVVGLDDDGLVGVVGVFCIDGDDAVDIVAEMLLRL